MTNPSSAVLVLSVLRSVSLSVVVVVVVVVVISSDGAPALPTKRRFWRYSWSLAEVMHPMSVATATGVDDIDIVFIVFVFIFVLVALCGGQVVHVFVGDDDGKG
jgi:hypothetical protein